MERSALTLSFWVRRFRKSPQFAGAALLIWLALGASTAGGQEKNKPAPQEKKDPVSLADKLSQSRAEVVKTTLEYKSKVEKLVELYNGELEASEQLLQNRKALFEQGLVSRREVEEVERKVSDARSKIEAAQRQIREADDLVAEVTASEQLAKAPATANYSTGTFIRFSGWARWSIADAGKVDGFFVTKFGHNLPVSAFGQSAFHERAGLDHHDAVDVAVHPDSAEGLALMQYLRATGIPFIAFRQAVPGSATGAHIHIGNPSHRITRPALPQQAN
jgi:hypothetical protein